MYAIFHKPTSQYLVDEENTNYRFWWTSKKNKAITFKTMDEAIDFWTFQFCVHFRTSARGLEHVIKESDIVELTAEPDYGKAYDRAMRGI